VVGRVAMPVIAGRYAQMVGDLLTLECELALGKPILHGVG
jgi:hypothetical protein